MSQMPYNWTAGVSKQLINVNLVFNDGQVNSENEGDFQLETISN
jgi:hypothetical protein